MFAALLLMVMVRFMLWALCVCWALVLTLAAGIGLASATCARTWNPERAKELHDAAVDLMQTAIHTAMFADNHRRWLVPNTQRSKRY